MYSDTIKADNKIITDSDLIDIFTLMNERLLELKRISREEELKNRALGFENEIWTFKDSGSELNFVVNFYDATRIRFDDFNNFLAIFNSRLGEIQDIMVGFYINYSATSLELGGRKDFYQQRISMLIDEKNIDITVSLDSKDKKVDDIYELIKSKILNAPPKYDKAIQNKSKIKTVVSLALGFIPALIISTALLFIPTIRHIFATGLVVYPLCCLILAFFIGEIIGSSKLDHLYKRISPERVYDGYDRSRNRGVYKDDISKYVQTGEILIGKNIDNLKCREIIMNYYLKYKKYLPYEIGIMVVLSVISLFLGGF